MSSPNLGFSPWRRRAASLSSNPVSQTQAHVSDASESQTSDQNSSNANARYSLPPLADSTRQLSTSSGQREPIRSFIHGLGRGSLAPADSAEDARSVREDTAELASYALSDKKDTQSPAFLSRRRSQTPAVASGTILPDSAVASATAVADDETETSVAAPGSDTILEVSEPSSPAEDEEARNMPEDGPSILSTLLRNSPPESQQEHTSNWRSGGTTSDQGKSTPRSSPRHSYTTPDVHAQEDDEPPEVTEQTPLLARPASSSDSTSGAEPVEDVEGQKIRPRKQWAQGVRDFGSRMEAHLVHSAKIATSPETWNKRTIWQNAVVAPVSCLPAVVVGLLLNVLDALSYGMILFPLGKPIFAGLGSAGISIFYVSTIVSQLTFSCGSKFRGAVGSELIEVVPFFHNMAQTITDIVGEDQPDAVIASTITSYALSSMLTGTVFFLMGKFNFGYMVGFIPRHILIGCIGGVGWFLVATGFEVSARMSGSLEYNLDTLNRLFQADTVLLWVFPLVLAIVLFYGQAKVASKYFLPLYILAIPIIFYFFVTVIDALDVDPLRDNGWIFEGPPADEPWWYFWTLYKFHLVRWDAVISTVPAMFALTFFGILHVPINVPALALQTGEDHADLDRELKLHGYSNFISGLAGSIQNYLVYANTVFFMRSGGDSRLAGFMLAALTFCVMLVGPMIIGFIPVMMVGCLIFDLGFELLLEAIWLPRKKLKLAEYLTVIIIVLVMGIYDFVVGIGIGVILAFISLIIQTSRVPAVRASYNGDIVGSTVRRNPSQHSYLQQVRRQIYIVKLTGFLFFGTIVSVEEKIRALVDDDAFSEQPIKFLVLDLYHVTGLDYSAGEAFNTISRLLDNKGVVLVISGVDAASALGRTLRAVGLGGGSAEVTLLPDLNSALESCENELLKTLYASEEEMHGQTRHARPTASLDVPTKPDLSSAMDGVFNSPRQNHLHEAAKDALTSTESQRSKRWRSFKEPLRLILQIFQGVSNKNEDFWFRAVGYFRRREVPAGSILYKRGERADGFYLVERGILRAEYDLPQGWLTESIVAGTTCGELPFFSETDRTANVTTERDSVLWLMDNDGWEKLQKEEPDVAQELLRISLKLTTERMSSITSYILTMAG